MSSKGPVSISPNYLLLGRKKSEADASHGECSAFSAVLQSRGRKSSEKATLGQGTTCRTTAVRDARRASSSALVASASEEYTPEKTIQ